MRHTVSGAAAILFLFAGAVFVDTLVHAIWLSPDSTSALPQATTSPIAVAAATSSQPVRLKIPVLGIDAGVQYLGINAAGNMQAPNNFTDVGWYRYGTAPGSIGSAVIDGHVDNGLALDGVFKHLDDLVIGDDVYVSRRDGSTVHFRVIDVESYPYNEAPSALIFSRADSARLNIITCSGTWVSGKDTYDQRLVVYTQLVAS